MNNGKIVPDANHPAFSFTARGAGWGDVHAEQTFLLCSTVWCESTLLFHLEGLCSLQCLCVSGISNGEMGNRPASHGVGEREKEEGGQVGVKGKGCANDLEEESEDFKEETAAEGEAEEDNPHPADRTLLRAQFARDNGLVGHAHLLLLRLGEAHVGLSLLRGLGHCERGYLYECARERERKEQQS